MIRIHPQPRRNPLVSQRWQLDETGNRQRAILEHARKGKTDCFSGFAMYETIHEWQLIRTSCLSPFGLLEAIVEPRSEPLNHCAALA